MILQRKITTFWGISILLIESVIVVFIFYFLYFFWIENPTPTSQILIVRAFSKSGIVIPKDINTTGWLKYSSDRFKFSLEYPQDLEIEQDNISYGNFSGNILSWQRNGEERFFLILFEALPNEEVKEAYIRLTGVKPSTYQSYGEKVGKNDAFVYRLKTDDPTGDHIFFMGRGFFFEANFDIFTADILSTFQFATGI